MLKLRMKRLSGSLFTRLIISYIFIIAIPVIIITFYSYQKFSRQVESTYHIQSGELLKSMENNIAQYFNELDRITNNAQVSENIKSVLDTRDNSQTAQEEKQRIFDRFRNDVVGYRSDIEDIYILDLDNYIYCTAGTFPRKYGYDIKKEPWYKDILEVDGKQLINVGDSPVGNFFPKSSYVIYISRLIKDEQDKPKGAILIELNFKFLQGMINKTLNGSKKKTMIIVDNKKQILYDSNMDNITKSLADVYPKLQNLQDVSEAGITGDRRQFVTAIGTEIGWTLILLSDRRELSMQVSGITFPILVLGISCLLIFVVISVLISKNISGPIHRLKMSMKRVGKGDLKADANLKFQGEIGELAESYASMVEKLDSLINEVYKVKIQKLDSEFKALQAQINPHFLYNVLEALNCIAQLEGSEKISVMVRGLARSFRYCIRQGNDTVQLKEEISHVNDYIMLVSQIYEESLIISYDIPDELMEYHSLRFILQPIVENAVIHGFGKKKRQGTITISAWRQEEKLYIKVWDNGSGIDEETMENMKVLLKSDEPEKFYEGKENKSIGIFNIHNRLRLYYGTEYGVAIESRLGYFTGVTICIPANTHQPI